MRYASVCSGVEAASLAWMPLGWEAVFFAEIEPFPCAVLKERFPDVPNLGDMTEIKGEKYHGTVDLLVGGTPCFVAGTMVLTPCGYKPIESLKIGDSVVTHTGDVRSITAIGSKEAQTGEVKILGRPSIRCTGNHPFYSIELKRDNKRNSSTYGQKVEYGEYEFKAVEDSVGRYAGRVTAKRIDGHIPNVYNATPEEIVELAGWYVGDGYIRRWNGKNKKAVIIAAVCKRKIDQFSKTFNGAIRYSVAKDGKITITNTVLADWLIENFGEKSQSKKLPYWIYTSELNNRFIAGYEKTDGSRRANGNVRISTTSAALAYGMADIYGNASVGFCKRETPHVIMGRKVSQRDTYTVYKAKGKTARTKMLCGRYASIIRGWNNDGAIRTVYNIAVDGEHSYIVNGIAVHNCQGFSVAGKQGGLNDPRSALCLAYCNLLETMRPRWFVWENVPGVFSTNGGEDFRAFLRKIDEIGYSCAWRVLDAQYVRVDGFPRAVPQRRRRVFVVGHLGGDWRYPASVLFEPGCLPGDTPPRREKRQGTAAGAERGSASTVWWDGSEKADTLTTTSDAQRMPDNGRLQCVVESGNGDVPCLDMRQIEVHAEGVAPTLIATDYKGGKAICFQQNSRDEVRLISQDGTVAGALTASPGAKQQNYLCYENHAQDSRVKPCGECSPQINAKAGTGGCNLPLVQAVAVAENIIGRKENNGGNGTGAQVELAYTQNATGVMGVCNTTQGENQNADAEKARAVKILRLLRDEIGEKAFCEWTLGRLGSFQAEKVLQPNLHGESVRREAGEEKTRLDDSALSCAKNNAKNALRCLWEQFQLGHPSQGQELAQQFTAELNLRLSQLPHEIASVVTVRRLLPIETERLMGFPDNHTQIPWRGKPAEDCPDSPRYKACGNSMCVNVMRWIGMRIENVERRMKGIDNE